MEFSWGVKETRKNCRAIYMWCVAAVHAMQYERLYQRSAKSNVMKMTDTHTHTQMCKQENTHSRRSTEPFQITAPSLIPSGWCSWLKAQSQRPRGGLELCQQLGPFQPPHVLFMETHRLSSLIGETPPQTSTDTHVYTHARPHRLIKGIRQSETWSAETS